MELVNKKENQITFKTEISESLANSIRRYVSHILTLAVDEIEISKNDSPLYDETIAHRIGLIPLKTNKTINGKIEINFDLDSQKEGFVYSGEMVSSEKNAEVVYDKMPITILPKGHELKLKATAKAGIGREHSKFSPGMIFYREIFNVKLNGNCPLELIDICPKKVFEEKNNKVVVKDSQKCDFCEECLIKFNDKIKIEPTKEVLITVESFGQIPPKEIFKKSIENLKKDLSDISKKIK